MEQPPPPLPAPNQPACDADQESGVQPHSDEFMMYVFKVEMCKRVDKHDRERCPYAHPGELARRRHPSLYKALPCPEARAKKICPRLENCNCSHSTFEFWLHPDRFKTFLCERRNNCNRPVCFFAHSEQELRALPQGLQRPRSPHKPGAQHSSTTGGAGSSRQAAGAGAAQGQGGASVVLAPAGGSGSQLTYVTQQGAAGFTQQRQQLQPDAPEQGRQAVMGYMPVMQQQQHVPQQHQGMPYMAVSMQQGMHMPDARLAGESATGPQNPPMQLMQQGQVLYAPAGDAHVGGVPANLTGQQLQQLQYVAYPPQQHAYSLQPAPQGPSGQYAGQYTPAGGQQVMIGYQPVQMGGTQGLSGPQSVLMVRPAPQRGATVAVIPAGPLTWSGSLISTESGEAPSLEALCAAMNHLAVPTIDSQPELLLQQFQQQAMPGQQQQQVLAAPQMQAAVAGGAVQLSQGAHLYAATAPGVPQVLAAAPALQQQSAQLLPGQQVMLMMPHEGAPVQGRQLGWGNMGSMQPGP